MKNINKSNNNDKIKKQLASMHMDKYVHYMKLHNDAIGRAALLHNQALESPRPFAALLHGIHSAGHTSVAERHKETAMKHYQMALQFSHKLHKKLRNR